MPDADRGESWEFCNAGARYAVPLRELRIVMQLTYGINPLLEGLLSQPPVFEKILIARGRGGEELPKILALAQKADVPVEYVGREAIEKLAPKCVHQGILGLGREHEYAALEDVVVNRHPGNSHDLVILLDGVADPRNLGAVIRTAHCLGANGVVIPENRAASITASAVKASAGAAELLPVARVVNLVRTIEYLKDAGFWIYGADAEAGKDVSSLAYDGNVALVMGSEGRGIRPLIRKNCDFLISVPMRGRVTSLNVSVATGVILFEILRKWGH
ncbi:MAG: 23S rRNA (guanosine(2251)-2'-O)-methyltransferase RlmB [Syntrophales bacterium]